MDPKIFKSGKIFADFLSGLDLRGKKVLDIGTGSGILSLAAALRGASVTATDKSAAAAHCALENCRLNRLDSNIRVVAGHLFSPLADNNFDIIVFNPPYLPNRPTGPYFPALYGGRELSLIEEFASDAASYLAPGGYLLLITSTDSDIGLFLKIFHKYRYQPVLLYKKGTLFEEFTIYKFLPGTTNNNEQVFVCPSCHNELRRSEDGWRCEREQLSFRMKKGVPDFVLPSRKEIVNRFLSLYQAVRTKEAWGSDDRGYYLSLPYRDTTGAHPHIWNIRSKTYDTFVQDLAREKSAPSSVLDVGAGNGWLSLRLAQRGYHLTSVDINLDDRDGLGVLRRIAHEDATHLACVHAEFDHLPFPEKSFDVVIFNASLHYSSDPFSTLQTTLRLLKENGILYVLDSPLYADEESGRAMMLGRRDEFQTMLNTEVPDELEGGFLVFSDLHHLREHCSVEFIHPPYGLKWFFRPILARLLKRRSPASFAIVKIRRRPRSSIE